MSVPQHHHTWGVHVGPEDHHTTTVEAAARYERDHSLVWDMDEPGPEDVWSSKAERDLEERDQMRTPRAGL